MTDQEARGDRTRVSTADGLPHIKASKAPTSRSVLNTHFSSPAPGSPRQAPGPREAARLTSYQITVATTPPLGTTGPQRTVTRTLTHTLAPVRAKAGLSAPPGAAARPAPTLLCPAGSAPGPGGQPGPLLRQTRLTLEATRKPSAGLLEMPPLPARLPGRRGAPCLPHHRRGTPPSRST